VAGVHPAHPDGIKAGAVDARSNRSRTQRDSRSPSVWHAIRSHTRSEHFAPLRSSPVRFKQRSMTNPCNPEMIDRYWELNRRPAHRRNPHRSGSALRSGMAARLNEIAVPTLSVDARMINTSAPIASSRKIPHAQLSSTKLRTYSMEEVPTAVRRCSAFIEGVLSQPALADPLRPHGSGTRG